MKYEEDFRYMSIIETVSDVNNTFLSRRELTCNFAGLGGKLKKLEAVDMITKEFNLTDKVIIPMLLECHSGRSTTTGTFYVYDDEGLAKKQVCAPRLFFLRIETVKRLNMFQVRSSCWVGPLESCNILSNFLAGRENKHVPKATK